MPLVPPWDLWSNFNFFQKFPNTSKVSLGGSSVCLEAIQRSNIKIYAFRIENFQNKIFHITQIPSINALGPPLGFVALLGIESNFLKIVCFSKNFHLY
jgi:hypothetical protein